ncbi:MAG: hypothetical protein IPG06_25265 [Haliea sp.]|nr:hypothetical protein [Haliea sp.]
MKYLDIEKLRSLSLPDFRATRPFPYYNDEGVLKESGFRDLLANSCLLEMFDQRLGKSAAPGRRH